MPNLMNQLLNETSTYRLIRSLHDDAMSIKTTLVGTAKTATDYVNQQIVSNPDVKHMMDWFDSKRGGGTPSSFDQNKSDEFDPGFPVDTTGENTSLVLDQAGMRDIAQAQIQSAADIAKNKMIADATANASIVQAINERSVDIVASLRKTSSLTSGILGKLNAFLEAEMTAAEKMRRLEASFIDANGRITVSSIRSYMDQVQKGASTGIAAAILGATGLGQIDQKFADTIMRAQYNMFEKLFSLKWLKKLGPFGKKGEANKDYSRVIVSKYNRDPAVFDNITRKTIVDVIPGYLKQITYTMTSHRFNVSDRGELTTESSHRFHTLTQGTLSIDHLKDEMFEPITKQMKSIDSEFKSADVKEAHRVIVSQYVAMMYQNGKIHLPSKIFENGGSPQIMRHVVELLVKTKGKNPAYWNALITSIKSQLMLNKQYRTQLTNSINKAADRLHKAAKEYAIRSYGGESLQFTQDMFDKAAIERLSASSEKFEHDGKTLRQLVREGVIKKSSLTADQLRKYDEPINGFADFQYQMRQMESTHISNVMTDIMMPKFQYTKKIFAMLNRGINVCFINGSIGKYKPTQLPVPSPQQSGQTAQNYPDEHLNIPMDPNGKPQSSPLSSIKSFASGIVSKIKGFFGSKGDDGDSERVSEILASMKTASATGGISDEESADLSAKSSGIQDPKQRAMVQRTIEGTKNRGKNKKQPKSLLGKAIFYVLGFGKSFLNKILSKAKTFLLNGAKWVAKTFTKGLKNVVSGAKSMASGFASLTKRYVSTAGTIVGTIYGGAKKAVTTVGSGLKKAGSAVYRFGYGRYSNWKANRLLSQARLMIEQSEQDVGDATTLNMAEEVTEREETEKSLLSRIASSVSDKLKNSSFVKGFMSAWQKDQPKVAKSVEDSSSDSINKLITGSSQSISIFNSFVASLMSLEAAFKLKKLLEKREKKKEKQNNEKESNEQESKDVQTNKAEQVSKNKGIGFDLGKITGGMSKALAGIMQSVIAVVTTMSGLTALMEIPKQILEKSLQPLNKVFQSLVTSLKPVVKTVQKVMKDIVQYIVEIAQSVIEIIQPILEAIDPIIQQLMGVLSPILDMLTDLISVLLVPLTSVITVVVVPIMKTIANTLSIQLGILQVGFGLILTVLGGILTAVGTLGKIFGAGGLKDTGQSMMKMGTSMLTSGFQAIKTGALGMAEMLKDAVSTMKESATAVTSDDETKETQRSTPRIISIPDSLGSPMDGELTGAGRQVGSELDNVTGSGDEMFQFSDKIKEAYKNLKNITSKLFSAFDMSDDDTTESRLNKAIGDEDYNRTKINVESANLSDEDKAAIDSDAFELFKKENPKYEGESDKEYEKRYDNSKSRYWTIAAAAKLKEAMMTTPGENPTNAMSFIDTQLAMDTDGNINAMKGFTESLLAQDDEAQQGSAAQALSQSMGGMMQSGKSSGGYDITDLITSVAKIYKAYGDAYPSVPYENSANKQITVNGRKRALRPDCSGIISAAIQEMGYKLKGVGDAGLLSHAYANANSNTLIYDSNGQLSSDWQVLPFSVSALQRGDITARPGHVSMPITQLTAEWPKGFDGGNSDHILKSVDAAKAYLAGDSNWESYLPSAMGRKWNDAGGATKIWRFVAKPTTYSGDATKMEAKDLYKYLVHNLGMSAIGASGILGILHYESGMRSNNLEDEYNKKSYFGMSDEEYTRAVDTGAETKKQFIYGRYYKRSSEQTAGEAVGYGLTQFTSSNLKKDLYERTVERGKSVSDAPSQLDMIVSHLKKMTYKGTSLFNAISSASTPTEANKYFFWRYAAGTSKNSDAEVLRAYSSWMTQKDIDNRHAMAEKYYAQFRGSGDEPIGQTQPQQEPTIQLEYMTSIFDLQGALDQITHRTIDVDSIAIKSLVSDIFDELPEYLEDDDDDEFEDIYEEESINT